MTFDTKTAYGVRDGIVRLLSDDEAARVSRAEAGSSLDEGDEYLDLERLELGVLTADGKMAPESMGPILPRNAVQPATWTKVLLELAEPGTHQSHFKD